ncbi:MAG: ABC transporter ATP-binding protein [Clostridiales bacterium]|nr:ABC transporter ATP-binding protein [Clostridiales bacterium]
MSDYIIQMINITKVFPGIKANDNITLQLKRGEIHALLGENGAGKSTLMSILFGLYQAEEGQILKDGVPVLVKDPNDANELGIGMVHQHFKLVHNFTVLENIVLGVETTRHGTLHMDEARQKVMTLSEQYGLLIKPDALIEDITVGMQQRVEILKMLYRDNEILIFDEPTAVLTPQEIDELMRIMRSLAAEGKSILFITHKLAEIMAVADRCTVLRKGKYIGTVDVKSSSPQELAEMMVGHKVDFKIDKQPAQPGEPALHVRRLSVEGSHGDKKAVNNVSFDVYKGEIVCIAGIDGNGQSELVYAITGLMPSTGEIKLNQAPIDHQSIQKRIKAGLAHIPEDRHKHGLVLDYDLQQNLSLKRYKTIEMQRHGFIRFDKVRSYAEGLIERFDIRSGQGADTSARSMSGGNQQKAIIAREIDIDPEVLIAVQPTRGLDVGAMLYIHEQLVKVRDEGKAILLISLELDEVFQLADRILVIYEGEIVAELDPKQTTPQELGLYMSGSKRQEEYA